MHHTPHACIGVAYFELNPGEVRLYMVGGRVAGKPLKEGSDIDLIFVVQDNNQSPGVALPKGNWPLMQATEYSSMIQNLIRVAVDLECQKRNLKNHFHVINYGSALPENGVVTEALLIGDGK